MLTPEQIADGWIEHDGGACPVADDARVEVSWKGLSFTFNAKAAANVFDWKSVSAYKLEPTP